MLSVSEPCRIKNTDLIVQNCVMQHAFNQDPKYNKWAVFEILGEERIKQMALRPQEEVEVAIDLNTRLGSAGRWFNTMRAYAVERDKSKWHRYADTRQRVAVMPGGLQPPLGGNQNGVAAAAVPGGNAAAVPQQTGTGDGVPTGEPAAALPAGAGVTPGPGANAAGTAAGGAPGTGGVVPTAKPSAALPAAGGGAAAVPQQTGTEEADMFSGNPYDY